MRNEKAAAQLSPQARRLLAKVGAHRPRVQCVTNTVAQALTANVLLAVGADASMALHPAELLTMTRSADALLINLGTIDPLREAAIETLIREQDQLALPVVLDPVFVHRTPLRLTLTKQLLRLRGVILKGNASEIAALVPDCPPGMIRITTGETDLIENSAILERVNGGHPFMAHVTGIGCALGAFIAAFAAVEQDKPIAAMAALECYGFAGQVAGEQAKGPGSFEAHFLDALWGLSHSIRRQ